MKTQLPEKQDRPLVIRGARTHNLKNISVSIPRQSLTVITGVSGSGKSSLAFDTIYAEGQRRYVESLSSYARQFLERMDKPDVDFMQGISPAMAIQQKNTTSNPRSTVGTTTEIYDYLRLMFARIGRTISPISGKEVRKDRPASVIESLFRELEEGSRFYITFPLPDHGRKSIHDELGVLVERGFTRILKPDETIIELTETEADRSGISKKTDRVLVDRLVVQKDDATRTRIADSLETAFREGLGRCFVKLRGGAELSFSEKFEADGMEFVEPSPQMFSFNNPFGACPKCEGFGRIAGIDEDLVIPDPELTIRGGAIAPFQGPRFGSNLRHLVKVCARFGYPIDTPYKDLSRELKDIIWKGKDEYAGIFPFFEEIQTEFYKVHMRVFYARYRGYSRCPECDGYRVRKDGLYVKINGMQIGQISEMTIGHAKEWFDHLVLTDFELGVANQILIEIRKRLKYLNDVGLDYLTLDRLTNTLSGGEAQRIHLANALGSSLIGSLYVLDEPTIGLHPRDNDRLIRILKTLRDIGNTVIVVEHDPEMIAAADHIIDIGPFAGRYGGEVVFEGSYEDILTSKTSLTGHYLSGRARIPHPEKRRKGTGDTIKLRGASEHNLKHVDVDFPLGKLVCVTGVSGSGKSTLVHDTLYSALMKELGNAVPHVGRHKSITGYSSVVNVEMVDQTPIGRSTRSNPATYTKAFDGIRDVFAETRQAKMMGYAAGHFSFNVPGGRCETCQGEGVQTIEMQFLADVVLPCEACGGMRYRKDVLGVKYRGKNIFDVLEMAISDALGFFEGDTAITSKLQVMEDVGLGYLKLGQSGATLSGGEAQRVKLARFLARENSEHTLYFFDEPTTGLHFEDTARLLTCFNRLIENGHSVILIEHNIDVIRASDWIIDVGPEGGYGGGTIVCTGTPEDVAAHPTSHTGRFLTKALKG
jgi:excinuclease ABC subunit A